MSGSQGRVDEKLRKKRRKMLKHSTGFLACAFLYFWYTEIAVEWDFVLYACEHVQSKHDMVCMSGL
jgi:hypothetical protein